MGNLVNMSGEASPNDKKIYARLFSYWFNKAGQQERYYFKTAEVKGEKPGTKEYVAIIIPRNHPQAEETLAFFDEETAMFNSMKP